MSKIFTTYQQQINLMKSRGIVIASEQEVISILKNHTYYSIINGYKDLFIDSASPILNTFIMGVKFEEIFSLYEFDNEIRILFLKYILLIESSIKSKISPQYI